MRRLANCATNPSTHSAGRFDCWVPPASAGASDALTPTYRSRQSDDALIVGVRSAYPNLHSTGCVGWGELVNANTSEPGARIG